MGKSTTSKYALEMQGCTSMGWRVKGNGAPTLTNLTKYVMSHIESLKPGGANCHISKALGYMPIPTWARIVSNDSGRQVVVEWKAPAFMVV